MTFVFAVELKTQIDQIENEKYFRSTYEVKGPMKFAINSRSSTKAGAKL